MSEWKLLSALIPKLRALLVSGSGIESMCVHGIKIEEMKEDNNLFLSKLLQVFTSILSLFLISLYNIRNCALKIKELLFFLSLKKFN